MKNGYLSIETHADHSGLIRILRDDTKPDARLERGSARQIRYIARFNDSEAGLMHTHEILKRRLIDLDAQLYRTPLAQGIAAIESLGLNHQRVYLDPDLAESIKSEIAALSERYRRRRRRKDAIFQILGYIAVAILLFNLFVLSSR